MSNMVKVILSTLLFSILPISELRGAIPYAYFNSTYPLPLWLSFLVSVLGNICVSPLCYLFINTLHKLLYKIPFYKTLFDKTVLRAQNKLSAKMNKYGIWGIMLFVAIPLPVTGAWTGTLASWISGIKLKKTFIFVTLGVIISGTIVSLIILTGHLVNSFI